MHAAAKAVYGSSLSYHLIPRNELIKTTSTLVYYGSLASGNLIILEYSGSLLLKAEVNSKGEKRFIEVSLGHRHAELYRARSDRTLTRHSMLFAVVADKLDLYLAESSLEKEKCTFY